MAQPARVLDMADRLPAGLPALQARAEAAFAAQGWPTRRLEAWKFTDLKRLAARSFVPAPAEPDAAALGLGALDLPGPVLVIANGRFRPDLSRFGGLPDGADVTGLDQALELWPDLLDLLAEPDFSARPILALNTARFAGGLVLRLRAGTIADRPIRLLHVTEAGAVAAYPRLLILAGENARATVLEHHAMAEGGVGLSVPVTQIRLERGATLAHLRHQALGPAGTHLATTLVSVAGGARYDGFELAQGAELGRSETMLVLAEPTADCRLAGLYLARGHQHLDTTTFIDHAVPDCRSRQVYKGVLDDKARGVFQGKILVRRGAQRTDGHQLNRALLLSRGAEIDAKPELEIYADDVKCSHGATAGELDRQALFYLRARGIGEREARALLVEAFISEVAEEIADPAIRDEVTMATAAWLDAGRNG